MNVKKTLLYTIIMLWMGVIQSFAQNKKAIIFGKITDAGSKSNDVLSYANVGIPALNLGTSTDIDGKFRIVNVPVGTHKLVVSYVGYDIYETEVNVTAGQEFEFNYALKPSQDVQLETVEIKAQAIGQMAAINQQVQSNTIVNVISREKLQELPDQNAAEALGRLAGVAIQRDGGEGQKVVLRGLSPRLNSITVNGERIPSTDGDDRSVDLSMISPDMLAGVEFFKAIRPDMDGDAIGGSVNFMVKKAPNERKADFRLFGGYNGLMQQWGQPRANASFSNRFLDKKLGVVVTGNAQQVNRSADVLEANYLPRGTRVQIERATLTDRLETRRRYGATLALDYTINQNHSFLFNTNWSGLNRKELRRRSVFNPNGNNRDYDIREGASNTNLLTNSLSGDHKIGALDISWRTSLSESQQKTPQYITARFRELGATKTNVQDTLGPDEMIPGFLNNLNATTLYDARNGSGLTIEKNKTAQVDLRYNLKLTDRISGFLKFGGKIRQTDRERDRTENFYRPYLQNENPAIDEPTLFIRDSRGQILMANFLTDYSDSRFLNQRYDFGLGSEAARKQYTTTVQGVDISKYNTLYGTNYAAGDIINYNGHLDIEKVRAFDNRYRSRYGSNVDVEAEDYTGTETIYASYLMSEINIGKWLMLMGGVRTEETRQQYNSVSATQDDEDPVSGGTRIVNQGLKQGYREFLPMAHIKIKPKEWFDVRLAYTQTLARPDFVNLVPWERINTNERTVRRGKSDLRHMTATNYDAQVSFYGKSGIFTVGGFYKELKNVDFRRTSRIVSTLANPVNGYELTQPENSIGTTKIRGLELDLQTNLRQLKGWASGIVLGANVTFVRSETLFPFLLITPERFIPEPPFFLPPQVIDTVRIGRMPGQADFIANAFVGYEKGRFSGRISLNFQDNTLNFIGINEQVDGYNDLSLRVDVAAKYKLDRKGRYQLFLNLNNLTNQPEAAFVGNVSRPQESEYFGATGELGFAWRLW
jgi:TonB-dependent receptor